MKITLISDTHTKHSLITKDLPGGDILIHSGDFMNSGYIEKDIIEFCKWFDEIEGYNHKIFIAGNHDRLFENKPEQVKEILSYYPEIYYLQDSFIEVNNVKIYGSPWQPEFYNWAFNLPKNGPELINKWDLIPDDTDILITHGPAYGTLDTVAGRMYDNLGCELLEKRIKKVNPMIHTCGHIHSGYGYEFKDNTHYFNASILDESYSYTQKPITFYWDKETNNIQFEN